MEECVTIVVRKFMAMDWEYKYEIVLYSVEECAIVVILKFLVIATWRFVSWPKKISMSYRMHAIVPMMTCGVE